MTRWLYTCLMWLAQPLLRRKLLRRSRQEPGYGQAIEERFGHYATQLPQHPGPTVWIHAVSLGETRAAAVLVAALRAQLPAMRLLLTHGTATGRAEGAKLLQAGDLQAWQPWDTPGALQRFLQHFRPSIGILMETEVWPNLVHLCQKTAMPLVLANARLSDKSLRQALRLAWLARPAYAALAAVWAQTRADADRLGQLGAPVRGIFGNLKFDAAPDASQLNTGQGWRLQLDRPVVMFASSREGEEQVFLQNLLSFRPPALVHKAQAAIDAVANKIHWLIVPRHPQRFAEVAALIESHGFCVSRRSSWTTAGPLPAPAAPVLPVQPCGTATPVPPVLPARQMPQGQPDLASAGRPTLWLGDSLGEMALYYGLADVALLGGSFAPLGGQNLIEAAACGCPVVMGQHTFNFTEAAGQAQAAGAALRVADIAQAIGLAAELATDASRLAAAVQAAEAFAQAHRGAAQRLVKAIEQVLQA